MNFNNSIINSNNDKIKRQLDNSIVNDVYNTYKRNNLAYLAIIAISPNMMAVTRVIMQIINAIVPQYFTTSL